jgi:hypothetical protein
MFNKDVYCRLAVEGNFARNNLIKDNPQAIHV